MIALTAGPELYSSEVDGISATVSQPEQLVAVSRAVENAKKPSGVSSTSRLPVQPGADAPKLDLLSA